MRDREFDFARAEDKDVTSEAKIAQAGRESTWPRRAATSTNDVAMRGDRGPLPDRSTRASARSSRRGVRPSRATSTALQDVRRAGLPPAADDGGARRPRSRSTASLREQDGLSHEDAVRDTVVSVLMSPALLLPRRPAPRRGHGRRGRCRTTPWPAA